MNTRNSYLLIAVITLAMVLPGMAAPQPWPEAHSGAYLGAQITQVTPQQASALKLQDPAGALITYVDQDGPACRAGLMENDVVVGYEGSKVQGPEQLQGLIHATPPKKTITLTVMRSGQRKDLKVTLGSWNIMSNAHAMSAFNAAPAPPRVFMPDVETPSFTLLSSRHGLVVESLSPQLADFFGVPRGYGVLVRSVEAGSPAAAAGLKAGDVIMKVNNEDVHDMADWQRGMHTPGKLSVSVLRDRREQNFTISVPGADNSRVSPGDIFGVDEQAQLLGEEMEKIGPEIERTQCEIAKLGPSKKELEKMRREVEKTTKAQQKNAQKMSREMAKVITPRDVEKMRTEIQKSLPSDKDWEEMRRQVQAAMPTEAQWEEMHRQIDESMKSITPEIQKQMEEWRKAMGEDSD